MKIRTYQSQDLAAVIALWQACGLTRPWNDPAKDIAFATAGATSTILVGEVAGEIIATVMVGHDGHRGALYYFAVAPSQQRRGLGSQLHEAAAAWLRNKGVWKINILVRSENAKVAAFYQRSGYGRQDTLSFGKLITV